jgi:pyruvate-formate lyase-activating enzyme
MVGLTLTVEDHDRDGAGLTYVYPVLSRRAGGVSVGINLNVNNACNWACVYCQVPGLVRGGPPAIDIARLTRELSGFLDDLIFSDYLSRAVSDPAHRRLVDVAFSGNGEPTAAAEFPAAVEAVIACIRERGLALPIRLITNGSQFGKLAVARAVGRLGDAGGEVWFKIDRATPEQISAVNGIKLQPAVVARHLERSLASAPTWIQTCWFGVDGAAPNAEVESAYLDFVSRFAGRVAGVHLYGIARPSCQPGASRLVRLTEWEMNRFADRLRNNGLTVHLAP